MAHGLANISSRELSEWVAYNNLSPVDKERRQDIRFAMLMALIANAFRSKEDKEYTLTDFLPDWQQISKEALEDETDDDPQIRSKYLLAKIEILNAVFGGQDLRDKK